MLFMKRRFHVEAEISELAPATPAAAPQSPKP